MKDNSGFFFIVIVIVAMGLFFTVDPVDFSNSSNPQSSGTTNSSDSNKPASADSIKKQLDDAEKRAAELQEEITQAKINETRSPYYEQVIIAGLTTNSRGNSSNEYIRLRTSSNLEGVVDISGWKFHSTYTNTTVEIPQGTNLYQPNSGSYISNILLSKNQTVYINSGISPVSESFRINTCSGYLEQFLDFYPSLSLSCPYPIEDIALSPSLENQPCLDYIDDLPRCITPTTGTTLNFPSYCTEYINQKINYPSCVEFHKNDDDFFKNQWMVYLERSSTLWRNSHETIQLLDKDGKIVGTYTN